MWLRCRRVELRQDASHVNQQRLDCFYLKSRQVFYQTKKPENTKSTRFRLFFSIDLFKNEFNFFII